MRTTAQTISGCLVTLAAIAAVVIVQVVAGDVPGPLWGLAGSVVGGYWGAMHPGTPVPAIDPADQAAALADGSPERPIQEPPRHAR